MDAMSDSVSGFNRRHTNTFGMFHAPRFHPKWERIYSHGNAIIKILHQCRKHLVPLLHSHRLGQIPWLIHVASPGNRGVVREQLQGDDRQ